MAGDAFACGELPENHHDDGQALGQTASRIDFAGSNDASIHIDNLQVATPDGSVKFTEPHIELKPGEHVAITGENGTEKTLFFRAIAGLWPWGSGRISHPAGQTIMFLPARAYVPPGTLRAAVTYPHPPTAGDEAAITRAIIALGLEHLESKLDTEDRWDRLLNDDEKQRIAFARVMLQKPNWVVFDNTLELLDADSRLRIESILETSFADVGIVNLAHEEIGANFFTRELNASSTTRPDRRFGRRKEFRDPSEPKRRKLFPAQ